MTARGSTTCSWEIVEAAREAVAERGDEAVDSLMAEAMMADDPRESLFCRLAAELVGENEFDLDCCCPGCDQGGSGEAAA